LNHKLTDSFPATEEEKNDVKIISVKLEIRLELVKGEGTGRSDFGLGISDNPLSRLPHLLLHSPFYGLPQEQVHHLSHVGTSVNQNQSRFQEQVKHYLAKIERREEPTVEEGVRCL